MILIRMIVMLLLIVPAAALAIMIWVMGGWTKGWDYMPNPVYALLEWVES